MQQALGAGKEAGRPATAVPAPEVQAARQALTPPQGEEENKGAIGKVVSGQGSNQAAYIVRRLKRDAPDIARELAEGKYPSARQAGIAAGIVKVSTALEAILRLLPKLTDDERRNQTRTERNYYIGCRYLREKQGRGGDRKSDKIKGKSVALDSAAAAIASEERCSHKHVKNNGWSYFPGTINRDHLGDAGPEAGIRASLPLCPPMPEFRHRGGNRLRRGGGDSFRTGPGGIDSTCDRDCCIAGCFVADRCLPSLPVRLGEDERFEVGTFPLDLLGRSLATKWLLTFAISAIQGGRQGTRTRRRRKRKQMMVMPCFVCLRPPLPAMLLIAGRGNQS